MPDTPNEKPDAKAEDGDDHKSIAGPHAQKLGIQASPKGNASLNGCFIPSAKGEYTRFNGTYDDRPKVDVTAQELAGRFVMLNPETNRAKKPTGGEKK